VATSWFLFFSYRVLVFGDSEIRTLHISSIYMEYFVSGNNSGNLPAPINSQELWFCGYI